MCFVEISQLSQAFGSGICVVQKQMVSKRDFYILDQISNKSHFRPEKHCLVEVKILLSVLGGILPPRKSPHCTGKEEG